jgi:hypothetical protein
MSGVLLASYNVGLSDRIRLDPGDIRSGVYLLQYLLDGKQVMVSRVVIR